MFKLQPVALTLCDPTFNPIPAVSEHLREPSEGRLGGDPENFDVIRRSGAGSGERAPGGPEPAQRSGGFGKDVDGDNSGGAKICRRGDGERGKQSSVRVQSTFEALQIEYERNRARRDEMPPGHVRAREVTALAPPHLRHDRGVFDLRCEPPHEIGDGGFKRLVIETAVIPASGQASPGPEAAAQGEPHLLEFMRRTAAGNGPTVERPDGRADDEVGLKDVRNRFPDAHLVGSVNAARA